MRLPWVFESLYAELSSQIEGQSYIARKGQIVDASIVAAPRQRNSREDNAKVKRGEVPEDWSLNKRRHKDVEARWTRKHGENHYGYKNYISMDRGYGLVRRWEVTDAARQVLDKKNTHGDVWADSAYRSVEQERLLEAGGWRSHIHRKGYRNRPLGERAREENQEAMGGKRVRTVGLARARIEIGMMNLVYNLRRLAWIQVQRRPVHRYVVGFEHRGIGIFFPVEHQDPAKGSALLALLSFSFRTISSSLRLTNHDE